MAGFRVDFSGINQTLAGAAPQALPPHLQTAPPQGGSKMDSDASGGGKFHKKKFGGKQAPNIQVTIGPEGRRQRFTPKSIPGNFNKDYAHKRNNTILISNPAQVTREEMLSALQAQCPEQFSITEYLVNKESVLFTIDNDRALNALLRLSKKMMVKGQYITISKIRARPSGMRACLKKETVTLIESRLGSRFNEAEKALVLTSLNTDAELASLCPNSTVSPSLWDATADVVARYCPNLDTLDLSNNNITSLYPLRRLFECCPDVTKLALSGNQIKSVEDLAHLRPLKKLDQLLLTGNLLTIDRGLLEHRLRRYVPTLTALDGVALQPVADQLLPPLGPSYVPPDVAPIVESFGAKFFSMFDNDRFRLINVYDDASCFSLGFSLNANLRNAGELKHQARDLLHRLGRQKLVVGASKIMELFTKFPKTSHDLQSITVDVWRLTDAELCVNTMGVLSDEWAFHRTFTLRPAAPGSTPLTQGWQVVIINDQLTILPRNRSAGPKSSIAAAAIAAAQAN